MPTPTALTPADTHANSRAANVEKAVDPTTGQPSLAAYFDAGLLAREQQRLFDAAPRYAGHSLAVPQVGDFYVLNSEHKGRALVHAAHGVQLISNVCRHRQAILLSGDTSGRGNTHALGGGETIVCPLHRWTYDATGQLLGAPHFEQNPCLHLHNYPLHAWNGLLFESPKQPSKSTTSPRSAYTELAQLSQHAQDSLDFSGFQFHSAHVHECRYNWKTFIEVYLEDYHVGPFHPGLGQFVTCEDLRWEYGAQYSVQTVGVADKLGKPGSDTYKRWHDAVLNYRGGKAPEFGAIWLTLYPNVMVEWYPHVLVVSSLHPRGPQHTTNVVEFFYPEEISAFEPEFIAAQQAAYWETCEEDDEIALRMDAGRQALLARGDAQHGPYQRPMEDGMEHFHQWYARHMR